MENKAVRDARISRLAKLCCNMSLVFGIVLLLLGLVPVIKVVYYIIAAVFAMVVMTFWLVSLILVHPFDLSIIEKIFGNQEIFHQVQVVSLKFAPYLCAVAVVLAIIGIVLISRDKSVPGKGRIVAASLAIGFSVVGIIALCLGVMR